MCSTRTSALAVAAAAGDEHGARVGEAFTAEVGERTAQQGHRAAIILG